MSLRIGLVSYEFATHGRGGGIGTYIRNVAQMLSAKGMDVEVFTCAVRATTESSEGYRVNGIPSKRDTFALDIVPCFSKRHIHRPFDVIEAREYGADLWEINQRFPNVPYVVKLATARYQVGRMDEAYLTSLRKARFILGGLKRGMIPKPFWGQYNAADDQEYLITRGANEVTSPTEALLQKTREDWELDPDKCVVIPHVFTPSAKLLAAKEGRQTKTVSFVGRLEVRKGVLELADAIPMVLKEMPQAKFKMVGQSLPHPGTQRDLHQELVERIGKSAMSRVEFTGSVPYEEIPSIYASSDIAVFPSYWEAFGFVCLEAMSSACGVVASGSGGMAEIIEDGRTGLLINPKKPREIANAIISLLNAPEKRIAMGKAAREHVLTTYSADRIAPLQIASYERAIENAKNRNAQGATVR
ncbi:MAG: glycosyltransferase family 4 protein [Pseudomonadota bacterium]